jgi:DNA-binding MurR/RpiR family transcriptional regulator
VLRATARAIESHARCESLLSGLDQIEMRLTIAHVVRDCRRVVQHVMEGSGAGAHYLDNELQRLNRDVQMMSAHTVFDLDLVAEQCGPRAARIRGAVVRIDRHYAPLGCCIP